MINFTMAHFVDLYPEEQRTDILNLMRGLGDNLTPYSDFNSAPRKAMLSTHIGQTLVINGSNIKYLSTGASREMGNYILDIRMPFDGTILKILDRYPESNTYDGIAINPEIVLIVEKLECPNCTTTLVSIPKFSLNHTKFGFDYVLTEALFELEPGMCIREGTVLATSPNIDEIGNYNIGIETNVCNLSDPAGAEDGFMVSDEWLKKVIPTVYGKRVITFGSKTYPLEMYPKIRKDGSKQFYGFMPDIGDTIRDDGVIAALREYDPLFAAFEMTDDDLTTHNPFDELVHGQPGATIVDIQVWKGKSNTKYTNPEMAGQAEKYLNLSNAYYAELVSEYENLERKHSGQAGGFRRRASDAVASAMGGEGWIGEPALTHEVGIGYSKDPTFKGVNTFKLKPLDEYRIEITYKYSPKPNIGAKATDFAGGKGVFCSVRRHGDMPVDEMGNIADVVRLGEAIAGRLIVGKPYENYVNASSRDVSKRVAVMCANGEWNKAWEYLVGFYMIISPEMIVGGIDQLNNAQIRNHLELVCEGAKEGKSLYLFIPPDTKGLGPKSISKLMEHYPPYYGPVTFRGRSGDLITTINPVEIGSEYMILLEKLADDYAAVAVAKVQSHGLPSPLSNSDKYGSNVRKQPGRVYGEAENRNGAHNVGDYALSELHDISLNPKSTNAAVESILSAEFSGNIAKLVDRDKIELGGARNVKHLHHTLGCGGIEMVYTDTDKFRVSRDEYETKMKGNKYTNPLYPTEEI